MYCSVPVIAPAPVIGCWVSTSDRPDGASRRGFARPKSSSFAPVLVRMMLPGFRSRWTMPARVGGGQCLGDLDGASHGLLERQAAPGEAIGQRLALEELHHQVVGAVLVADVEERADVRVAERRDGAGLAGEPLARVRIADERRRQHLDGDGAVEARVVRLVDLTHAPGADRRGDLVGPQASAFAEQHRVDAAQNVPRRTASSGRRPVAQVTAAIRSLPQETHSPDARRRTHVKRPPPLVKAPYSMSR